MFLQIQRSRAEAALQNVKTRNTVTTTFVEAVRLIAESIHMNSQRVRLFTNILPLIAYLKVFF